MHNIAFVPSGLSSVAFPKAVIKYRSLNHILWFVNVTCKFWPSSPYVVVIFTSKYYLSNTVLLLFLVLNCISHVWADTSFDGKQKERSIRIPLMMDQCPFKWNILVNLGLLYMTKSLSKSVFTGYSGCWSLSHLPPQDAGYKWKSPQFIWVLTYKDKQPFTLKFTPVVSLEEFFIHSINCCGRKLVCPR